MEQNHELWIIGNGFNRALAQSPQFSSVSSKVLEIASLWEEFSGLISEVKKKLQSDTGSSYPDEKILEFIFIVLQSLKSKEIFSHIKYQTCFDTLVSQFSSVITKKLESIALKFFRVESEDFYSSVSALLEEEFLPYWHTRRQKTPTTLITTNYDGIVDTIFARNKDGGFGKYGMGDLFASCDSERHITDCTRAYVDELGRSSWKGIGYCFSNYSYLQSHREQFKDKLLHLHGSYKFWKHIDSDAEVKIDKQALEIFNECLQNDNWYPMVVFGPPEQKLNIINKYKTLQTYLDIFKHILFNAEEIRQIKLVIWGTKFESDPHLYEVVRKKIEKGNVAEVVILLSNPYSAEEFCERLMSGFNRAHVPQCRYVAFDSAHSLLDVIKKI